jgi:hypothetical protein
LIVRTKVSSLNSDTSNIKKWILEAQLENCSEDVIQLEKVVLDTEEGLGYHDCNWSSDGDKKPVLHPGEIEQVCFLVQEKGADNGPRLTADGRMIFGVLGIGWRGEMGCRGFLSTGKLGARVAVR